jgi:acetyl esterase/lipase
MRDGYQSELRIYLPVGRSSTPRGMFVLIHGGGFCLGKNFSLGYLARPIATLYNLTVVCPSYRLAPEHRFPAAPQDMWDSLKWLSQDIHAKELECDLSLGFYIGGVSAGGTLTAVMAQRWASEGCQPPLTGAWVSVPCVLEKEIVQEQYQSLYLARDQNARSLVFNQDTLEYITKVWHHDRFSPDFSPFQADNPHRGMPPVYIQVAGKDPLRDDGLIYEKALRAHGVKTKLDVYPGLPHGFEAIFRDLQVSRKSMMDTLMGIGWLTGKEVDVVLCEPLIEESYRFPVRVM